MLVDCIAGLEDEMVSHPSFFHCVCCCFLLHFLIHQPLCGAASFGKICWENRKDGDMGEDCLVTVDGKDFKTEKQGNVKIFWGHKFKNSGLHYKFAFCIKSGWLVWIHGPFPCGNWPDLNIFCHSLKIMLDENEWVEADDG